MRFSQINIRPWLPKVITLIKSLLKVNSKLPELFRAEVREIWRNQCRGQPRRRRLMKSQFGVAFKKRFAPLLDSFCGPTEFAQNPGPNVSVNIKLFRSVAGHKGI